MNCPNCSAPMEGQALGGIYGPDIEVDLCFACHLMWLDRRESIQLSPGGTLALFEVLHEHRDDPRHALGARMACPRCRRRLSLTRDIGRGGRFSYYSCPSRDGRLTPFSEFLKEKQFVRSLSPAEQSRVRAELKSVQCSGCGAPVDLVEGFKCQHCGSPITVLDADAVAKALRDLESAEARRSGDPAAAEARARALAALESLQADRDDPWRGGLRLRIGSGP
ncbi:MAG TPA: zf-TFIIB domain-containing protein, partial [Longimicrobiales bacterium]|nr:zf-TFIIB domain-containing protein [Longimicrobiales bacterium]